MTGGCVLVFGDDVVAGSSDACHGGIVGRLAAAASEAGIELVAYNLGIVGETSLDVSRRWRKESTPRVAAQPAWQPVFCVGVNDPGRLEATISVQAMQKIALRSREKGRNPLVIGPPPLGDARRRAAIMDLSRRFAETCGRHDVDYCETATALVASAAWNAGLDGGVQWPGTSAYDEFARVVRAAWLAWLGRRSR